MRNGPRDRMRKEGAKYHGKEQMHRYQLIVHKVMQTRSQLGFLSSRGVRLQKI